MQRPQIRLLHAKQFKLQTFPGPDGYLPNYAVLSPRGICGDVTYQEIIRIGWRDPMRFEWDPRYEKIRTFRKLAWKDNLSWVWIEDCCVDKNNRQELSNAINLMWQWYSTAAKCYVYLEDVTLDEKGDIWRRTQGKDGKFTYRLDKSDYNRHRPYDTLAKARWFSWASTLQALLAPKQVTFYNKYWGRVGRKQPRPREKDLAEDISQITRIPLSYLVYPEQVQQASIAMRMSWAAYRRTKSAQDQAYCLLGLFGIQMPITMVGDDDQAFFKLQREIIKKSDDESIFAWTSDAPSSGLLAPFPRAFRNSGNTVSFRKLARRPRATVSNNGLQILLQSIGTQGKPIDVRYVIMFCGEARSDGATGNPLVIKLKHNGRVWRRVGCNELRYYQELAWGVQLSQYSTYVIPL